MATGSAQSDLFSAPFIEILEHPIDREAAVSVSAALCRRHRLLPIERDGNVLVVAMADPDDILALDDVSAATRLRIRPVRVDARDLATTIDRYHRADDELSDLQIELQEQRGAEEQGAVAEEDDAPIVRFVNLLIAQAVQDRASDIHIEPGESALRIRYRIDGVLKEVQSARSSIQAGVISRLKVMAELDIAERRRPQDGRIAVLHQGRKIDLRVATLPTVWGEKVVMRILDNSKGTASSVADLSMSPRNLTAFRGGYTRPTGMVLVTGPTGSGKSTTLYTALQDVSKPSVNVITVEDPVEYRIPGVNQVQVNAKAGLTFAAALRSILRSDPDIVLIGEIRDHETAQIATEAALTGHLVLSTLHTNDAPSAITRLIEMGIEPYLVGSALVTVVAQRLARRLCDKCKRPAEHSEDALEKIGMILEEDEQLFAPVGCSSCAGTGFRGRIGLHEVMTVDEQIERLTIDHAPSSEIARAAIGGGMLSLRQDGWNKACAGLTSIEEVLRVVA